MDTFCCSARIGAATGKGALEDQDCGRLGKGRTIAKDL
jgi:hypothetical protein